VKKKGRGKDGWREEGRQGQTIRLNKRHDDETDVMRNKINKDIFPPRTGKI